jgi:hypothetical protein
LQLPKHQHAQIYDLVITTVDSIKNHEEYKMEDKKCVIDANSLLQHCDDIISTVLDDEIVIMSVDRGNYYSMDKVGSYIWQLMEKPLPIESLCSQVMQYFDVERNDCETDLFNFVRELAEEGLIDITAEPHPPGDNSLR